jgi:DNA-binding CsgD family transcriptional regulator
VERYCWACTAYKDGTGYDNGFVGWLGTEPMGHMWAPCDGCGLHLLNNDGRTACGSVIRGDLQMGCEFCHQWAREQNRAEQVDEGPVERNGHAWRKAEDDKLIEMWKEGRLARDIAVELNRSKNSVRRRLHRLRVLRFEEWQLLYYRATLDRPGAWTPAEVRKLLELVAEGKNNIQIGAFLGRTPSAINRKLYKLGNPRGEPECLHCGLPIVQRTKGRKRKYCDQQCQEAYAHRQARQAAREEKRERLVAQTAKDKPKRQAGELRTYPCAHCQRPAVKSRIYCDDRCQRLAYYERAREKAAGRAKARERERVGPRPIRGGGEPEPGLLLQLPEG